MRIVFTSFCAENGKKCFLFQIFYDFFFLCPIFFVILARVSRKRVHRHICSNSPDEPLPRKEKKRAKPCYDWNCVSADFIHK